MFKCKHNQAQSIWEYTMLFSLIMAFMIAMGMYFRRGVQARIRVATVYAVNQMVRTQLRTAGENFVGNLYYGYEPYYVESSADVKSSSDTTTNLAGVWGTSGIYSAQLNEQRDITSTAVTAPPGDAH